MAVHRRERVPDGSVVRIRDWDDMEADFGEPRLCDGAFVSSMRKFCGQYFTIKSAFPRRLGGYNYDFLEGNHGYTITADMFDVVPQEDEDDPAAVSGEEYDVLRLLGG